VDEPRDALALADPGECYVVYLPRGGDVALDLSAVRGSRTGRWLDPRTGATRGPFAVPGGGTWHATAPDAEDWVLHLDTSG
jgi:hypothetical protein